MQQDATSDWQQPQVKRKNMTLKMSSADMVAAARARNPPSIETPGNLIAMLERPRSSWSLICAIS